MEGYNPTVGCAAGCRSCSRTWVPFPKIVEVRRDPLIDAYARMDNPCERPARCGPCCTPYPKFRRPKEQPECDINCYREEEAEAKHKEACEAYRKYVHDNCPPPPCDGMLIRSLDPNRPLKIGIEEETPPERQYICKEVPCRTNILIGYFNPDDNKTPDQKMRERCDQTYLSCGPNLPMYPCRAAINYPPLGWTTLAEEQNKCQTKAVCEGSKYCDPEYIRERAEDAERIQRERAERLEKERQDEEYVKSFFDPAPLDPCCKDNRYSLSPYCNCGVDMTKYLVSGQGKK